MKQNDIIASAKEAAKIADEKKAEDIVILDLQGKSSLTDIFVICSVTNPRQARAVAQAIEEGLKKLGEKMDHIEGYSEATWILIDFINIIVHIFLKETREHYGLEHLWGDAPQIDFS